MSDPWDIIEDPLVNFIRDVHENGVENSAVRRYYSKYEALVISNKDPQDQGRILVRVFVLKREDYLDVWAYPSAFYAGQDYGAYFPPEEGDHVWVWFDHGKPAHPGYSGGWWLAPKKTAASSYLPSEFKTLTPGTSPTTRGIKTKKGHALAFDDSDLTPGVDIWSGQQLVEGADALKRNLIRLSDVPGFERLTLETFVGHALRLIDNPVGFNGVVMETLRGIRLFFDETLQLARLETPGGREILIDDLNILMAVTGLTGEITIDDADQTLNAETVGVVNVEGALGVNIDSPGGLQTHTGTAGLEQTFTGPVTQTFTGDHTRTVTGSSEETVTGTYQKQITGASSLTFLGGLIVAVTGSCIIGGALAAAAGLSIGIATAGGVTLGSLGGVFFRLVTEQFITLYNANVAIHNANVATFNTHVHPFIGNLGTPGVTTPTATPMVGVAVVDPNSVTTFTTVAN